MSHEVCCDIWRYLLFGCLSSLKATQGRFSFFAQIGRGILRLTSSELQRLKNDGFINRLQLAIKYYHGSKVERLSVFANYVAHMK